MMTTAAPLHPNLIRRAVAFLLLSLMVGNGLTGCASCRGLVAGRHSDPMAGAPRLRNAHNPQMEEIVAFLNQNTQRIQGWRANSVKIVANQWPLSGTIAVEKGNHVRLVVTSALGKEVDLGSNEDRFWLWSKRMDPAFVTCRHENMEAARQQLGIPFDPHWLMQALGVESLSTAEMKMEIDPSRRQARLIENVNMSPGRALRRTVLVDLKNGTIIEHALYNYEAVPIALARLSAHRVVSPDGAVLPHRVLLEWPQNQMSMTMDLGKINVNPQSIPAEIWEMPDGSGYPVVQLDGGIPSGRIAILPESAARIDTIEIDEPDDEENDDPQPELIFKRPLDQSGRARLLDEDVDTHSADDKSDDWAR